jgi:hypothetical protein
VKNKIENKMEIKYLYNIMSRRIMSSEVVRAYKRVHFLKTKLFIYQLRIGTKSAFEFHNYR